MIDSAWRHPNGRTAAPRRTPRPGFPTTASRGFCQGESGILSAPERRASPGRPGRPGRRASPKRPGRPETDARTATPAHNVRTPHTAPRPRTQRSDVAHQLELVCHVRTRRARTTDRVPAAPPGRYRSQPTPPRPPRTLQPPNRAPTATPHTAPRPRTRRSDVAHL